MLVTDPSAWGGRAKDKPTPKQAELYYEAVKTTLSTVNIESTAAFAIDLRNRVIGRSQISSDGFHPYVWAITYAFGRMGVDYAQIIKAYSAECTVEASRRYSPNRVVDEKVEVIIGTAPTTSTGALLNVAMQGAPDTAGTHQPGAWTTLVETGAMQLANTGASAVIARFKWPPAVPPNLEIDDLGVHSLSPLNLECPVAFGQLSALSKVARQP